MDCRDGGGGALGTSSNNPLHMFPHTSLAFIKHDIIIIVLNIDQLVNYTVYKHYRLISSVCNTQLDAESCLRRVCLECVCMYMYICMCVDVCECVGSLIV